MQPLVRGGRARTLEPAEPPGRGLSARRSLAAVLGAAVLGTLGLAAADRAVSSGEVRADGRFDHAFFRDFNVYRAHNGSRVAFRRSALVLSGLRRGAPAAVEVEVSPRRRGFTLTVLANGEPVATHDLTEGWNRVAFEAPADASGRVALGFRGGHVRVAGARVQLAEPGSTPRLRWLAYLALGGLAGVGACVWTRRPALSAGAALAACAAFAAALAADRLVALHLLPRVLVALAAVPLAGVAIERVAGVPRLAAHGVAAALVLKLALVTHPAFPSIDAAFHAHNLEAWRAGELITSRAPGADQTSKVAVPYPPGLYALLAPLGALDPRPGEAMVDSWVDGELLVRVAQALLVGTGPLLVFLIGRRGGLDPETAGAAAVVAALMPESLLVLGKGIAANTLGAFATLLVVLAGVASAPFGVLFAAALLAVSSHLGAGATAVALVAAWLAHEGIRGRLPARDAARWMAAFALAGLAVWLLYYRAAWAQTAGDLGGLAGVAVEEPEAFFGLRGYRVGKAAQNLVLKLGAVPVVLAAVGVFRGLPQRLASWLGPWAVVGGATALVAFLTPVPLRFEYFLVPAVALAAGAGLARLRAEGRTVLVGVGLTFLAALHLALAALLLAGRVRLIAVIMESPRWPWPIG